MGFSGAAVNTNWATLAYAGTANPAMTSEDIPVIVDSTTTYSFSVTAAIDNANWSSGFTCALTFYNASNSVISAVTASSATLVSGAQQTVTTTPTVAPSGAVYCVASLQLNGSPASTNPLDVYNAAVGTGSNTTVPDIVNYNYAFVNGSWPWVTTNNSVISTVASPLTGANGNYDSLVISGIIEIMGGPGGVPCNIPNLTDPVSGNSAIFRISTPGGQLQTLSQSGSGPFDLGNFQPTQDFVESLSLDGERPFGTRSSNRQMSIPIAIYAPTQQTLDAARDYLLSVIDQQSFEIAWTPQANGLTTIYECFRALPSTIMYGFNNLREGASGAPAIGLVTVSIQAMPFGKSGIDGKVEVDFASGLVNGSGTNAPVVLDNFSGTIDTSDGWILNTQYPVIGSDCVFRREPHPVKSPYAPAVYQATISAKNIVGLPVLSLWLGQSYDTQFPSDPKFQSNVTVTVELYDTNGHGITAKGTFSNVPWNANPTKPTWKQVSLTIPQKVKTFSYNAVTGYVIRVTNWTGGGQAGYVRMNAWLGYLSANPMSVTNASSPRGILYNVFGLVGSARSAVSAQVQYPNTDPVSQEYTRSGTFQVPVGVTSLQAECWAGGGAGSSVNTVIPGGGGGGGEYAMEPSVSVTPGTRVPMTIGAGGLAAQLVPTVQSYATHGVALTWTAPANVTSATVELYGGGAAGAPGGGGGGAGGYGKYTVTVTPGTSYSMWAGSGGKPNTGTTSQALSARNGQNSWFGPLGTTSAAGAYCAAGGGLSSPAGSAEGGLGGAGKTPSGPASVVTAWHGGNGGRSPGGAGGGGGAAPNSTAPGLAGSASPKLGKAGAGDYLTGGAGGTGPGGAGGAGANSPGAATAGSEPGGAGGGGYTKTVSSSAGTQAVNYQGAAGASGWIVITYTVNGGSPVNGGSTVFGSSTTTSKIVTAHGGTSAAANSGSGAAGGTGSANSTAFFGGNGGLPGRNSNGIQTPAAGSVINQASRATATGVTSKTMTANSTLTTAFMEPGVMMVVTVLTSAALVNPVVSDTAGHVYYLAKTQALTDGSSLATFVSTMQYPIISGQVLTVSNSSSLNWLITWSCISGVRDLEDTAVSSNAGNSTAPSVTRNFPDNGASYLEFIIVANDSTVTSTGNFNVTPGIAVSNSNANGSLSFQIATRISTGSGTASTATGVISSAVWAVMSLPFVIPNQNGQAVPATVPVNTFTGTSGTITNGPTAAPSATNNFDAGAGMLLVKVQAAAAATYTITDSASNTYTLLQSQAIGTAMMYVYGSAITASLTGAWTLTATSATSQHFEMAALWVPGATAKDTTGCGSAGATGTAVSLAYPSTTTPSDFWVTFVGYASSTITLSSPAWTNSVLGTNLAYVTTDTTGPMATNYLASQQIGAGSTTFSATLSTSVAWGAIVIALVTPGYSGGGGSSGGAGSYGADGSNGLSGGGPSYTFGGKGANGVLGNAGGLLGSVPGGGGSGAALSSAGTQAGGNGGNGMIRVTHQPPLIAFNDFLLHRPGQLAPPDLVPLVPIPVSDPPDNREYAVPQTVAGRNARFGGTYSVLLCNASWDTPSSSRRISVTVNQYEYPGGPGVSVQATRTLTPATDIVNGYVDMGAVTLPVKQVDPSNTDCYYTVSVHDTDQSDSFQDLIFLDTQGQTCLVNIAPGTAGDAQYVNYYYDEPGLDTDLGSLLGSSHERDRAISVLDMGMVTGGPLYVAPGNNLLLAYSSKGAPNLSITYSPRWYSDRII